MLSSAVLFRSVGAVVVGCQVKSRENIHTAPLYSGARSTEQHIMCGRGTVSGAAASRRTVTPVSHCTPCCAVFTRFDTWPHHAYVYRRRVKVTTLLAPDQLFVSERNSSRGVCVCVCVVASAHRNPPQHHRRGPTCRSCVCACV